MRQAAAHPGGGVGVRGRGGGVADPARWWVVSAPQGRAGEWGSGTVRGSPLPAVP